MAETVRVHKPRNTISAKAMSHKGVGTNLTERWILSLFPPSPYPYPLRFNLAFAAAYCRAFNSAGSGTRAR